MASRFNSFLPAFLVYCLCFHRLFAQSEIPVSVTWWDPEMAGSVSLGGKGYFSRDTQAGTVFSFEHEIGKLPYPMQFYIQPGMKLNSTLLAKSDFEFSELQISTGELSSFSMDWSFFGLQIPLEKNFKRKGLRPGASRLGIEWHRSRFSLTPQAGSALVDVDRSINALTLELEWRHEFPYSDWELRFKPRGSWMQDLGGSPASHLEGEVGFYYQQSESWSGFIGFKRKKTRLFPSQRLSASTLPNSDFIFILDGPVVRVAKRF